MIIAALSSSISLVEVLVTYLSDRAEQKGKKANRSRITWIVSILFAIGAVLVAWDGLGANGLWVPFQNTLGIVGEFNDCWLDFLDCIAEGIAMPLGALFMSFMIGWELKPSYVLEEIGQTRISRFYSFCIRFVCPVTMLLVLAGQLDNFFKLGWFK